MRCPSCAKDVPDSSRFCPACGAALESRSSSPTQTRAQDEVSSPISSSPGHERFPLGTLLAGRYRIVGLLGRGGMGEVYRADDLKLGRPVALKFLPQGLEAEPGRLARFLDEVRLALKVTHPNVCRVHDIVETDGQHFLSMEYVDGEDLASLLRRIERFPRDRAIRVARQLCAGLAAAHDQGILHRDLKPTNIMIDGRGQLKITDFGLAGIADQVSGAQARLGTPAYMAPEQFEGREVTVRSDVYALGLVLYELFTGKPAFEAKSPAELVKRHRESTPVSPDSLVDDLDPSVGRVILRCLEKDPRLRPASALAVASALPGGDPIAAALAAGETPSPELLAEAGQAGALRPALAWAGLAAVVFGAACIVLLGGKVQLARIVPLDKPAVALAERAREIVHRAGYEQEPVDSLIGFLPNDDYIHHLDKLDKGERRAEAWAPLYRRRPAGLLFWYRQSPQVLAKLSPGTVGDWLIDPPRTTPGMVDVSLDPVGRLQSFSAVPPEHTEAADPLASPDWTPLLSAAGLTATSLRAAAPSWAPPVFADHRAAWDGVYPDAPDVPIHIEAASYQNRPVWLRIIEPWTEAETPEGPPKSAAMLASQTAYFVVFVVVLIGAAIIATRNVRQGRGDRRTALRFALYLGGIRMLWLIGAHHVPTVDELGVIVAHMAFAMYRVGLVWLFYMALEPYARRLWPQMLVSWVRLFGGRPRDPLVGRDLLVGAVLGVALGLANYFFQWSPGRLSLVPFAPLVSPWNFEALRGLRQGVAAIAGVHTQSVLNILFPIMLFLILRVFLRRTRPAIVIVSLAGAIALHRGSGSMVAYAVFILLVMIMVWIVLLRFGLLSVVVGASIGDLLTELPITFDLSAWYAGPGLVTLLLILGTTTWAFRASLAGRPLFRDEILEAEASARPAP